MTTATIEKRKSVEEILGSEAQELLNHTCSTIPKENLHLPGPDFVDRIFAQSDRNNRVLGHLNWAE